MNDELPAGWAWATIEDLISEAGIFSDGDWVESKDQDPGGDVRLVQLADVGTGEFRDRSKRFLTSGKAVELNCTYLAPGDVLVARMPDPLGRACQFPRALGACVTVVDVAIVRPCKRSADPTWLMWSINSPQFNRHVEALQSGTTRKRISRKNLAKIGLALPPLAEQKRIVAAIEEHFSRLDFAEAALEVARAKLQALRRSVLAAAFSGRLTNPTHTADTDTDQLPEGWERVTIREVSNVVGGATPKTTVDANWGGGISWITPDDLSGYDGVYIEQGRRSLTREGYESCSAQLMPAGSVLFTSRAPIGYVTISSGPVCTNQGFKSFVPQTGLMSEFLYWYLRFATPDIQAMGSGTTFKEISKKVALSIPLVLPPIDEQEQVVIAIEELFSRLDAAEAALEIVRSKLQAFRRSVLVEAFAGRLVPQNPDDEPAAALLARIAAERPGRPTSRKGST